MFTLGSGIGSAVLSSRARIKKGTNDKACKEGVRKRTKNEGSENMSDYQEIIYEVA
jgi:hypothetical protein